MSDIVLSASVRQNLLSLQSHRRSARDHADPPRHRQEGQHARSTTRPTTSPRPALDTRAGDISNLLDSIGNGVQVLQAANTGITSLQKLVDTAKSIANQALQQPSGLLGTKAPATTARRPAPGCPAVAGDCGRPTNGGTNSLNGATFHVYALLLARRSPSPSSQRPASPPVNVNVASIAFKRHWRRPASA